jgi:hypothetical protein
MELTAHIGDSLFRDKDASTKVNVGDVELAG